MTDPAETAEVADLTLVDEEEAPEDGVNYGLIDDTTPIGRRFEIETASGGSYMMTLRGFDGERVRAVNSHDDGDDVQEIAIEDWRDNIAPYCVGYTDPQTDAPPVEGIGESMIRETDDNLSPGGTVSPELLCELRIANAEYHKALLEFEDANEVAKYRKKLMETAQGRLNEVCDEITTMASPMPLFVGKGKPAGDGDTLAPDAWRAVLLEGLAEPAVKPRYLRALAEHDPPITTLGELTDWQKAKGDFWAKDIAGMGPAGQESLAAATEAFWTRQDRRIIETDDGGGPCDGNCGWEELHDRIETMLADERYEFAQETLQDISDWVFEHEHCTEAQKQAIENIATSVHD